MTLPTDNADEEGDGWLDVRTLGLDEVSELTRLILAPAEERTRLKLDESGSTPLSSLCTTSRGFGSARNCDATGLEFW